MDLKLKILGYFISIKPTSKCIFSRRNGYRGKNFLGYNFYFTKINLNNMGTLKFGEVVELLKKGRKAARLGWNGKGMFIWLKEEVTIKSEWCKDPMLKKLADDNGGEILGLGTICMYTHDSTGRKAILSGWAPSQSDMLSEDWILLPEE